MDEVINYINLIRAGDKRAILVAIIVKKQSFGEVAKALHMARSSVYRIYKDAIRRIDAAL